MISWPLLRCKMTILLQIHIYGIYLVKKLEMTLSIQYLNDWLYLKLTLTIHIYKIMSSYIFNFPLIIKLLSSFCCDLAQKKLLKIETLPLLEHANYAGIPLKKKWLRKHGVMDNDTQCSLKHDIYIITFDIYQYVSWIVESCLTQCLVSAHVESEYDFFCTSYTTLLRN